MKKMFIVLTLISFLYTIQTYAFGEEHINLKPSDIKKLEALGVSTDMMLVVNHNGQYVIKEKEFVGCVV